jgi:MFS family permease
MGIIFLIAADIVLATAQGVWQVMVGVAIWGIHMGATQGLLSAIIANIVPADLRGTAFGLYSLVTGVALLATSVMPVCCGSQSGRPRPSRPVRYSRSWR